MDGDETTAPARWVRLHRALGVIFVVIYVVMMWQMVPRLWQYQTELPARTVIHAVCGITIGFLLLTKILISRGFDGLDRNTVHRTCERALVASDAIIDVYV